MEFWKVANALEKELTFIVLKDFGIKSRPKEPNFFSKVYNMKAEDAIVFNGLCEQYGITRVTEDYPSWFMDCQRRHIIELLASLKENIRSANEVYPYYMSEYYDRRGYQDEAIRCCGKLYHNGNGNLKVGLADCQMGGDAKCTGETEVLYRLTI